VKTATSSSASGSVGLVLKIYFLIALFSTTGVDNLLFITVLLMSVVFIGRVGATLLSATFALFPRERASAHQPAE
jgi:hypothetical protein